MTNIDSLLRLADGIASHGPHITYPSRVAAQEVRRVMQEPAAALRTERATEAAIEALRAWFKFQSMENTTTLYNAAAKPFGSDFNPAEYDDVE